MNIPERIDTSGLANTPSYLMRRFKEDQAPTLLRDIASGDDLVHMFKSAISREPDSMKEMVAPYLCLCAMSLKPDIKFLRAVAGAEGHAAYKWLRQCAEVLIQEFRPVIVREFKPGVTFNSPSVSIGSNTSTNSRVLTMFNT
jgi:hypothetical protein